MKIIIPTSDRIVFRKEILTEVYTSAKYDRIELSVLNTQARVLSSQLYKRIGFGSEEIYIGAELSIGWSLIIWHILQEFLTSQKEYIMLVDLNSRKARCKIEWISEEVCYLNLLPLIGCDVVSLYIYFLVLRNTKAIDGVIINWSRLMGLDSSQGTNLWPLFGLQWISDTSFRPLVLFYHATN